jgi:hypothetical protein
MTNYNPTTEEYNHLAKLCKWAGFDYDPATYKISIDGIVLPTASMDAYAMDCFSDPHTVIASATKEFEEMKEFNKYGRKIQK